MNITKSEGILQIVNLIKNTNNNWHTFANKFYVVNIKLYISNFFALI